MNTFDRYPWQWAMMYYTGGTIQDLGYYSLFSPEEYRLMTAAMAEKAMKYPFFRDEQQPAAALSRRMSSLMRAYNEFIMPSLTAAFRQGDVTFVTPFNATGRWSYANRHGRVLVVADREMARDINRRISLSGMQLRKGIEIRTADITAAGSLEQLKEGINTPVYFSLGLLPLTADAEYTEKALAAISHILGCEDNLTLGFISAEGSNLPRGTPIFTPAEMESILSRCGFNVYEDSTHIALDGTEITFFLAVKKLSLHR